MDTRKIFCPQISLDLSAHNVQVRRKRVINIKAKYRIRPGIFAFNAILRATVLSRLLGFLKVSLRQFREKLFFICKGKITLKPAKV